MARLADRVRVHRGRVPAARGRQERPAGQQNRDFSTRTTSHRLPIKRPRGAGHRGSDGQAARTGAERKRLRRRVLV